MTYCVRCRLTWQVSRGWGASYCASWCSDCGSRHSSSSSWYRVGSGPALWGCVHRGTSSLWAGDRLLFPAGWDTFWSSCVLWWCPCRHIRLSTFLGIFLVNYWKHPSYQLLHQAFQPASSSFELCFAYLLCRPRTEGRNLRCTYSSTGVCWTLLLSRGSPSRWTIWEWQVKCQAYPASSRIFHQP